jgi:acetoin utilization protein AcuB
MDKQTPVKNIMTSPVLTVEPNDIMTKVQDIFQSNDFHHLPVVNNGKVVGIISKSDFYRLQSAFTFFRREREEAYNNAIMRSLLVKEVMSKQVASVQLTDSVSLAAAFFRENLFHCLPVVDGDEILVGIITPFDLLNFAFKEPTPLIDN